MTRRARRAREESKGSSMTIGCISTGLPAAAALQPPDPSMRAAQQNSLTLKTSSQLPPTTGFFSTKECYTRDLSGAMREAQHFFRW